jgi:hypothetical protein
MIWKLYVLPLQVLFDLFRGATDRHPVRRLFVGITDYDWSRLHASKSFVEEVNFWRPSPEASFKALQPGEPFLFKLHAPRNFIVVAPRASRWRLATFSAHRRSMPSDAPPPKCNTRAAA